MSSLAQRNLTIFALLVLPASSSRVALCLFMLISLSTCLTGKHVVFGKVTDGMDVVKNIEKVGSRGGSTSKPVVIADCGEL